MAFVVWAGKISEASLFKPAISRPKLCRETGLESPKIGEIFRPLRGLYDERTIRAPFWCNELEMTLNMHSDGGAGRDHRAICRNHTGRHSVRAALGFSYRVRGRGHGSSVRFTVDIELNNMAALQLGRQGELDNNIALFVGNNCIGFRRNNRNRRITG